MIENTTTCLSGISGIKRLASVCLYGKPMLTIKHEMKLKVVLVVINDIQLLHVKSATFLSLNITFNNTH